MKQPYGLVNRVAEELWIVQGSTCPSLRYRATASLLEEAKRVYRDKLCRLHPECMRYDLLLERKYMKEKHWIYAIVMAAAESLPLLYQECTKKEILHTILAKASLGASSKLLDNLNDEIHTVEEALSSLENYLSALKTGTFEMKCTTPVERAESASCEMASWIYHALDPDVEAFSLYTKDCAKLVDGQIGSLQHKKTAWPSLGEYVELIAEKSIGDVWIDVDLCQFDSLDETLYNLKKGNEYIFKSSLVYDDVQDICEDIQTKSVNSAVILGFEQGIISADDLSEKNPSEVALLLQEAGVLRDTIHLADALFLKGVDILLQIDTSRIDMKGLMEGFKLVRLFNLRKLLLMNKDLWTLKQFLATFSDFQCLRDQIPVRISRLVN